MAERSATGGGPCCISHAFLAAATACPGNIALIHAAGGAKLCGLSRAKAAGADDEESPSEPMRMPVYEGDACFTFSDVLSAVESLSRRIRLVLDGGDDPHLLTPKVSLGTTYQFILLLGY